jgi:hypothetical protein
VCDEDARKLSEEPSWRFLGLRVARKTELIALAAFFLSVTGLLWQIFHYVRGPLVTLFHSDQVVITSFDKVGKNYQDEPDLLGLIATFSYVNDGDIGHNAVIRQEYIKFELGNRQIEHQGYLVGKADLEGGRNLAFKDEKVASPFAVMAGSAVSREVLLRPRQVHCDQVTKDCNPRANFVLWDEFLKAIKLTKEIKLKMGALIYSKAPTEAACEIRLRDWEITLLEKDRWLTVGCVRSEARLQRRWWPATLHFDDQH